MGYLTYANSAVAIEIEDEMLAHLRMVAITKLRRGESFALTVPTTGTARATLWIQASIPIQFETDKDVDLRRPLLVSMMEAANTSGGLDLADQRFASYAHHPDEARHMHAVSA